MVFPKLKKIPSEKTVTKRFFGLNVTGTAKQGEFSEMKNCVSDEYPFFSSRRTKRTLYAETENARAMISRDALCYVDDGKFYINGHEVTGLTLTEGEKKLVPFGNYVLIFPDAKWADTVGGGYGNIENRFAQTAAVTYRLCAADGSEYSGVTVSPYAPELPSDRGLWLDTGGITPVLKIYSATDKSWSTVPDTCVKISSADIGLGFAVGDDVMIAGVQPVSLAELNGVNRIEYLEEDCLVVRGITDFDGAVTQNSGLTVKRELPLFDCCTESGGRLWCCRYGLDRDGGAVNKIYASRLNDFRNFLSSDGSTSGAYSAPCGGDGAFTAAVSYLGYPVFFRENCLHKVYGSGSTSFQIQTTFCDGVGKNCGDSAVNVGGKLYYKSRDGVCRYDGSLPVKVSDRLGDLPGGGTAGTVGNKYYLCACGKLLVYDVSHDLWTEEDDDISVSSFCRDGAELYYIDGADGKIKTVLGSVGEPCEDEIHWWAASRVIGADVPEGKYISGVSVNLCADAGSKVALYIRYGSGKWERVCGTVGSGELRTVTLSVRPKKCACFRIGIGGVGGCTVTSVSCTVTGAGI